MTVSWKRLGGPRWSLTGLEREVGSLLPLSLSPSFSIQIGFSAGMCSSQEPRRYSESVGKVIRGSVPVTGSKLITGALALPASVSKATVADSPAQAPTHTPQALLQLRSLSHYKPCLQRRPNLPPPHDLDGTVTPQLDPGRDAALSPSAVLKGSEMDASDLGRR